MPRYHDGRIRALFQGKLQASLCLQRLKAASCSNPETELSKEDDADGRVWAADNEGNAHGKALKMHDLSVSGSVASPETSVTRMLAAYRVHAGLWLLSDRLWCIRRTAKLEGPNELN